MEEKQEMACDLNYEALYNEYRDKYNCIAEKCAGLEAKLKDEHEQKKILEAQMEVVRLIFGGADNG